MRWTKPFLITVALIFSNSASSMSGKTYDIEEEDALAEVHDRVSAVDWPELMSRPQESWGALNSVPLPAASEASITLFRPVYKLPRAVDVPGVGFYPVGYEINPLDHISLPGRIVVIRDDQAELVADQLGVTDLVLVSGNPFEAMKSLNRQVYLYTEQAHQRFAVTGTPAYIDQVGKSLRLTIEPVPEQ